MEPFLCAFEEFWDAQYQGTSLEPSAQGFTESDVLAALWALWGRRLENTSD